MKDWNEFKLYMLEKYPICENCGSARSVDVHHWIIHRMKHLGSYLDVEENCGCVCRSCHDSGIVNGRNSREKHWARREEAGFNMDQWYSSLPLKFKERF